MFQGKARKGWDPGSSYAARMVNKVPLITRFVSTTYNMAKKPGEVGGRKLVFVCFMYYYYKVTEEKPNNEQNIKFVADQEE